MKRKWLFAALLASSTVLSGCANTVYGPSRLLLRDGVENPDRARNCSDLRDEPGALNIDAIFVRKACAAVSGDPTQPDAVQEMVQAGLTISRMRCNDFFAQRAANQTRQRIIERAVLPVSALLTGVIGLIDFSGDGAQQDAVTILGLGQTATIAGLEIYESEFLFGAANVNAVRKLTMTELTKGETELLKTDFTFHEAARKLIDHQMICTPANILELAQTALRNAS